jgi:hypothetical protein
VVTLLLGLRLALLPELVQGVRKSGLPRRDLVRQGGEFTQQVAGLDDVLLADVEFGFQLGERNL